MTRIGILVGSTRPGRKALSVAEWVLTQAADRSDAEFEIVDISDFDLPLLDERYPAGMGRYEHDHTKRWAEKIGSFDGFVIVTPEYNHSTSGALKNALDYIYAEWNNKAVGFVSYGSAGGTRAVEHLRLIAGELQMADVRAQVSFSIFTDFETPTQVRPADHHAKSLAAMLDQVVAWSRALATLRAT
ncbi:MAG: NAD(P)H-dependent oxidoreductase [Candidatus Nanopelagicales bacterium]|nr:NAD(P)H-dependent oxidoreductase [Candidatus Nanopelagicales bacterium]MDZ4249825.1 NAD(P)H-dependent oxidoreductase [Candidatus Nanopelagicales bacterium]